MVRAIRSCRPLEQRNYSLRFVQRRFREPRVDTTAKVAHTKIRGSKREARRLTRFGIIMVLDLLAVLIDESRLPEASHGYNNQHPQSQNLPDCCRYSDNPAKTPRRLPCERLVER